MTTRKMMFAALCVALTAATGSAFAMPKAPKSSDNACVFSAYNASAVAPFNGEENYGYGNYTELKGAQIFVPAREGLTEQWLTRVMQSTLRQHDASSCQPAVKDLQVNVVSAGPGFWVQLIAPSQQQGRAVLDWAKGVVATRNVH